MSDQYSRRSFLSGVLTAGTLTAGAVYLHPRGGSVVEPPDIPLTLATGADPTRARDLLIDMWNRMHPDRRVTVVDSISSGSGDERTGLLNHAEHGTADILNLDVVDVPEFAARELIAPVELDVQFIEQVDVLNRSPDGGDRFDAVPLNADVGMLFSRGLAPGAEPPTLKALIEGARSGVRTFAGQLDPGPPNVREAFLVNVLEHALAQDEDLISRSGNVVRDPARWQAALEPLRQGRDHVAKSQDENDTRELFVRDRSLRHMRNWPIKYWELRDEGEAEGIRVDPLPIGILGGQSLAVAAKSRYPEQAREVGDLRGSRRDHRGGLAGLAVVPGTPPAPGSAPTRRRPARRAGRSARGLGRSACRVGGVDGRRALGGRSGIRPGVVTLRAPGPPTRSPVTGHRVDRIRSGR